MTRTIAIIAGTLCLTLIIGCGADGGAVDVNSLKQAAKTVYQTTLKGGGASARFGDALSGGYVDVWESGAGPAAGAFLSFQLYTIDPTSEVCFEDSYPPKDPSLPPPPPISYCYYTRQTMDSGWGNIPAQGARVSKSTALVDTVVQSGPDFQIEHCVWDMLSPEPPTCTSAAGGAIQLTFRSNGLYSAQRSGAEQYQSGPYLQKTSGVFSSSSATVSGTLLGHALNNVEGYLNSSNGASVTREIARP